MTSDPTLDPWPCEPHLYWLRIVEVVAEIHQDLWYEARHIVREGLDTGTQAQYARVAPDQGLHRQRLLLAATLLTERRPAQLLKLSLEKVKRES